VHFFVEKLEYCFTRCKRKPISGQENGIFFNNPIARRNFSNFNGENLLLVMNISHSSKQNALYQTVYIITVPLQVYKVRIHRQSGKLSSRNKLTADFHSRFVKKKHESI